MSTHISDPSDVVGARVRSVSSKVVGSDPYTKQDTHQFLIELSNDRILDLRPDDILLCDNLPTNRRSINLQIIDGPPSVVGEEIVGVVARAGSPRQVALLLSSGRALLNVLHCGGGSILHVEGFEGLARFLGKDWHDLWSSARANFKGASLVFG